MKNIIFGKLANQLLIENRGECTCVCVSACVCTVFSKKKIMKSINHAIITYTHIIKGSTNHHIHTNTIME